MSRQRFPRARALARRALTWVMYSPRRAKAAAGAVVAILMVAFITTTTTTVNDMTGAVAGARPTGTATATSTGVPPGLPQSTRTAWPGESKGGPSATSAASTPTSTGTAPVKMAGGAADTTRRVGELWLEGAGKPQSDHAAWAAKLDPYLNPAMRAHVDTIEMSGIPDAKIINAGTQTTGDLATTTLTLSNGRIVTVQAMRDGDEWQTSGFYFAPK